MWWLLGFIINSFPSVSLMGFGKVYIGIFIILSLVIYIGISILSLIITSLIMFIWWILGFITNSFPSISLMGFGKVYISIFIIFIILFIIFHEDKEETSYKQWRKKPEWTSSDYVRSNDMKDGGTISRRW